MLELTRDEKQKLEGLINPDGDRESNYQWDGRYQEEILAYLLMDRTFLVQSMELIKPSYFLNESHKLICSILFKYFKDYNQLPPKFTIVNEIKKTGNDKKLIWHLASLDKVISQFTGHDNLTGGRILVCPGFESREACLDKITVFAKEQALKSGVSKILSLLESNSQGKWEKIRSAFKDALSVERNLDLGLDYFNTAEERYDRMKQNEIDREVFITGFSGIDLRLASGGLCRGEIGAFMSLPGVGKSNALVRTAVQNLMRGKKALYVSLEMNQDKIARRFDAQITASSINSLQKNREMVVKTLKEEVQDQEEKRRLIIKHFPAGTANVDTLRALLAQLNLRNWTPDLLCLDYVGEMKDIEGLKTYESRQRLVRDLRGFAEEEKFCVFTAMQPNRSGKEQQEEGVINDASLGDSFGQSRPLDALWSINQRQDEKKMGLARIFIVKHRDGISGAWFPVAQNPETLDFYEIDEDKYHTTMSMYNERKVADTGNSFKLKKFGEN